MPPRGQPKWSDLKRPLTQWGARELLGLIHELYELSDDNRAFLAARLAEQPAKGLLEPYRRRVTEPFYPRGGGFGELHFADARKAIREYEKATGDVRGAMDLMLTFVETGNAFTREFGDIDARFYLALESMLDRFFERLATPEGRQHFADFEERLSVLKVAADGFGWGYSDYVVPAIEDALRRLQTAAGTRNAS